MADFFTKPLTGDSFFRLRNAIMNLPPRGPGARAQRSPRNVQLRLRCDVCQGVGEFQDSECAFCDGRGYDLVSPAVPSAGGVS
eukprot:7390066-Prymnesium_polylepis.1